MFFQKTRALFRQLVVGRRGTRPFGGDQQELDAVGKSELCPMLVFCRNHRHGISDRHLRGMNGNPEQAKNQNGRPVHFHPVQNLMCEGGVSMGQSVKFRSSVRTHRATVNFMNLPRYLSGLFALGLLGFSLAGCKSHMAPVADGYEKVTHPTSPFSFEPVSPRISFQFREASGKNVLIWPDIYGGDCVVKGGLAVFLGDKAYMDADGKATHPRLFAVKAPELPMDITDEVLWRWSKSSGRDFSKAMNRFSLVTAEDKNGRLGLHLEFVPGGNAVR